DQHRARLLELLVVGRRDDAPVANELLEALGAHVFDVALAAVQCIDDRGLDVDEQHTLSGFAECRGERDADVARADDGDVVQVRLRHGGQAYRAAAIRSAACPSPYSCGASGGNVAAASAAGSSSGSASRFAPAATVSTHSVLGRSVTHGTRSQYASFCRPPESVTTLLAPATRSSISRKPSGSIACTFGGSAIAASSSVCRVRGCTGKTKAARLSAIASTIARSRVGSVFACRWIVSATYGPATPGPRPRASGANTRSESAITSPTTSRLPRTPSFSSCCDDRSSGQKSSVAAWSTSIRLRSSGIERSKLRSPASTCATGTTPSAARAPAAVELVSP